MVYGEDIGEIDICADVEIMMLDLSIHLGCCGIVVDVVDVSSCSSHRFSDAAMKCFCPMVDTS